MGMRRELQTMDLQSGDLLEMTDYFSTRFWRIRKECNPKRVQMIF